MIVTDENRALVLASLYNNAKCQGMGLFSFDPHPMSEEEARTLLDKTSYFDYVKGRVLKIDLGSKGEKKALDFYLYDRDNGNGAGERACKGLEV